MVTGENIYPVRDHLKKTVEKGFNWHICIKSHIEL